MGMFSSLSIASSGLTVQRLRQDVIADNIANVETTRTPEGGVFRRKRVIVSPQVDQPYWKSPFLPSALDNGVGKGVRVDEIQEDMDSNPRLVYDPTHPDAIKTGPRQGYVEFPNVNVVTEMVDLISASRSYDANIAVVNGAKAMFMKALEIGR
ncbi:flagellar basal body rod protein FlgC [Spirochaeta lutea]|uniref:Flagellar basal-body rod protein FlgC n=1 Tax=Spirochaeta lutea TaxID=1480694 RepID=A0A098R166_9SPIO|nr:flagellar basal body rod protein FlgC [Spirochaeta lutea]KGE73521.1 flagellar basal body rod protein FlgC [Spirochaeta lutea]